MVQKGTQNRSKMNPWDVQGPFLVLRAFCAILGLIFGSFLELILGTEIT